MLNVAVVGYGHIGKQHCANVMADEEMELSFICDPHINEEDLPEGFDTKGWFKDYDTFIDCNPDVGLIIIATPNHLHYPMLEKAMTAPHFEGTPIFAEKPIVLETHEIEKLEAIQAERIKRGKTEIPIFVNYPLRFLPSVEKLKDGWSEVGNVNLLNVGIFWNRNEGYYEASSWRGKLKEEGGPLFNEFIHHLDLISYLCGDIEIMGGRVGDFNHDYTEVEDTGIITMNLQNGGFGVLTYTVATPHHSFDVNLHFIGENGSAKLTGLYTDSLYLNEDYYQFPINREHYGAVLKAIKNKIVDGVDDERLCYWREGCKSVKHILHYYSLVRKNHKLDKGSRNISILTNYNKSD